ncbi:putative bifunctional diguanylate cyclase/phosphodiesterase [Nitratireductor basaltis]|nr:EAL domain-containing protein [Nitratireductor basaltis]
MQQLRVVCGFAPAFAPAALMALTATVLALVSSDVPATAIAIWVTLAAGTHAAALFFWWKKRDAFRLTVKPERALSYTLAATVSVGLVWSAPALMAGLLGSGLSMGLLISLACGLCATGIALSLMPRAAFGLVGSSACVLIMSVIALPVPLQASAMAYLLVLFIVVTPIAGACIARVFSERATAETGMREQQEIINLLLCASDATQQDCLWQISADGRIAYVSPRFRAAMSCAEEQVNNTHFGDLLRSICVDCNPLIAEIERFIDRKEAFQNIVVQVQKGEERFWWRLSGKPSFDMTGEFCGYIGVTADITAQRKAEARVNFLAHNDALTGLINRGKFTEHLNQCVARLERYGSPFAVLYLDLDQFKAVNDSRGHLAGDMLLAEVGRRLRCELRECEYAARLGGDEFAIILTDRCDANYTAELAQRIVDSICKPYDIHGECVQIGISIGIALAPVNGTRPDQILRNADLALYRAKEDGRGLWRFFESRMDADNRERRMLELELSQAIREGELELHFQPLVSAETQDPLGFEALVRWNHPIRGMVQPAEFIPIAEQSALIREIGDWTIREACRKAAQWPGELMVAVNISARHFQLSDIAEVVRLALRESGLPGERLELEITESLLIEKTDDVLERLREIKAEGVAIAMDDFGTGYSSLSYLMKFPFDKIKIDRSFVSASSEDTVARDILRSIIMLGETLKVRITAEGVETQEQVEFLRGIACQQLQGFYFARPLNPADLAHYFIDHFRKTRLRDADMPADVQLPLKEASGAA